MYGTWPPTLIPAKREFGRRISTDSHRNFNKNFNLPAEKNPSPSSIKKISYIFVKKVPARFFRQDRLPFVFFPRRGLLSVCTQMFQRKKDRLCPVPGCNILLQRSATTFLPLFHTRITSLESKVLCISRTPNDGVFLQKWPTLRDESRRGVPTTGREAPPTSARFTGVNAIISEPTTVEDI